MLKVAVVILNYRRAALTIDALRSVAPAMAGRSDRAVVCIDNGSDDGSADQIDAAIREHGWGSWLHFIRSPLNRGFAGGNNLGIASVAAEYYMLLNSDARLQPDALDRLIEQLDTNVDAGAIGPALIGFDGTPQISCFRHRTPLTEFLEAAGTGVLDRLFAKRLVPIDQVSDDESPQWMSCAAILLRGKALCEVGGLDEQYFMYFEDIDLARRMKRLGWRLLYDSTSRVVHLRGGTSSVKAAMRAKARVPRYYYESRSRYFATYYGGRLGLWFTNACWCAGRAVAFVRELFERRERSACRFEFIDNWTNCLRPFRSPAPPQRGEL